MDIAYRNRFRTALFGVFHIGHERRGEIKGPPALLRPGIRTAAGRNRRWAFHESVGLGYARYTEQMGSLSGGIGGLGFHVEVGFEYKLAQNVGIGASVGTYGTRFSSMDDAVSQYNDDQKGGISRISLNGGLRFYF